MNLAVVYLGNRVPTYVYRNLISLKRTFPAVTIYFISDNQAALNKASGIGIKTFKASLEDENVEILKSRLSHPLGFRDGFWLHTTSRFFAIMEFSYFLKEPFIQVEADVFLLKSFPLNKFEQVTKISFPLETPFTGAASIFYVPNSEAISEFVIFLLEMTSINSRETDMTLLGKYWSSHPEKVTVLPSIPKEIHPHDEKSAVQAARKELDFFGGLFDPLTYGMHLLGEDPMNARGWIRFGKKPVNHLISGLNLTFELKNESLFLVQNKSKYEIFCLHVHSKNLQIFEDGKSSHEIQQGIKLASGNRMRFSPQVFLKQLQKSVRRRLARTN